MDFETRKVYFNRCDPLEALPDGDDRYEPFDESELRGPEESAHRLLRNFDLAGAPITQLFTGLVGSGKSTELQRFTALAEKAGYLVAYSDVIDRPQPYLDRSQPLQVADLLFAVCLVIDEALGGKATTQYPFHNLLPRLWETLSSSIGLDQIDIGAPLFKIKLQILQKPSLRKELNRVLESSPLRFKEGISRFIQDADAEVRNNGFGKGLLVVLDGLEKVAESELAREVKEEAFREVFLSQADLVRVPCHILYPISAFMIQHSNELGTLYHSEPLVLPMIRICKCASRIPDPVGIKGMCSALDRRLPIAEAFAAPEVAELLVRRSGGFMRDLLRFAREALAACPDDCETITEEVARRAIRRVERSYRDSFLEDYRLPLQAAHKTWDFPLTSDNRTVFGRLLRGHMLLRYHNEQVWYDAHPLLWSKLENEE